MKFSKFPEQDQIQIIQGARNIDKYVYGTGGQTNYLSYVPSTKVYHFYGLIYTGPNRYITCASIKLDNYGNIVKITPKSWNQFMKYKEGITSVVLCYNSEGRGIAAPVDEEENYNYIRSKFNY